jgi:hypothetical protein
MKSYPDKLNIISPAEYRIIVIGSLDEGWSARLCGLEIVNKAHVRGSEKSLVTLTGEIADQAALLGVLNALYNMRMPLVAVECLNFDQTKGDLA